MADLFSVSKEIEFDAGHRVPLHMSKCRNPHGHRYRVVVHCVGALVTEGSSTGMVIDFSDIKQALTEFVHDRFDHGFIVQRTDTQMLAGLGIFFEGQDESDFGWKVIQVNYAPTAENLAADIYHTLLGVLGAILSRVDVYETPTSCATFPVGRQEDAQITLQRRVDDLERQLSMVAGDVY